MKKEYDVDKIRQTVLDFVIKKWKELGAAGKEFYGIYHNGVYGSTAPSREVWISKATNGVDITYIVGERGWSFSFTESEYKVISTTQKP